jgi:hypothetical protein
VRAWARERELDVPERGRVPAELTVRYLAWFGDLVPAVAITALLPGQVAKLLAPLADRERSVVRLRFGLDRCEPETLDQVGAQLRLTRERVRRIEARAMSKLRHPSAPGGGALADW